VNAAGVGMSGAVAKRTNESSKALGGKVSYLWSTLAVFARWRNTEVRVSVDDEIRSGRMHEVVVANGRYFGGGMMITPEAEPRRAMSELGPALARRAVAGRGVDQEDGVLSDRRRRRRARSSSCGRRRRGGRRR